MSRSRIGPQWAFVVAAVSVLLCGRVTAVEAVELKASSTYAARKDAQGRATYIVRLRQAPLALYAGEDSRFPMPERDGRGRLRSDAPQAKSYLKHLQETQLQAVQSLQSVVGRVLPVRMQFTHAINGLALDLTEDEAARMRELPEVAAIEVSVDHEIDTDVGPLHIGAHTLWDGSNALAGQTRGEGVVVGIVDSGINFSSPSFAQVEPASGYAHVNPLGSGNALGTCAPGAVDAGRCNDKLIGAYDFVYTAVCDPANPTTDPCRTGGTILEETSAVDNNGHGTHTAGTAAGNAHAANYLGGSVSISGVAPRANIIAYDACYTNVADGRGLCPTVSTLASVEQAVADGLVDVINYSIGGGSLPWTDSVSQAFLSASNAGIFVAASAGNSGPGPNTMGHHEPWTTSVAALTHSRGTYVFNMQVNDSAAVLAPANYNVLPRSEGATYAGQAAAPGLQLKLSPALQAAATTGAVSTDLCNSAMGTIPAGHFTGTIALVRRGTCGFGEKAANAAALGATGLVIFNNGGTTDSNGFPNVSLTPTVGIPVWTASTANGDAMFAYIKGNAATTRAAILGLATTAALPATDSVASFSSRGPNPFNLLKPDIGAPGVNILAPYAGAANSYNIISGTSMASPHVAGSAALIRALRPSWTPMEVKSALMMVSRTTGVTKENGTTPADAFDRGAGRVDLTRAAKVGLVLNETGARFSAANPATGGDTSQLNLASFQHAACVGICSFTRTVQAARTGAMTYNLSVSGVAGATVSPASFTINSSGTRSFTLSIDGSGLSTTAYSFGEVTLTPTDAGWETLRMPIAVRGAPPEINLVQSSLNASVIAGDTATVDLTVQNLGNNGLTYTARTSGSAPVVAVDQPYEFSGTGFRSSLYTDTPSTSQYASDDFVVGAAGMTMHRVEAQGFNVAGSLAASASALSVFVFPDNGGQPSGDPSQNPGAAIYSFQTTTTGPGVSVLNNTINIDLVAAGQNWPLGPGTYWLVVRAHLTFANRWVWYANTTAYGQTAQAIAVGATPPGNVWGPLTSGFQSLAMRIDRTAGCGAPWITGISNQSGNLGASTSVNVQLTLDSAGLSPGVYQTYVCVDSNDSDEALTPIPVNFTVNGIPTPPTLANPAATPNTVPVGGGTVLTVQAEPGTFPPSTGMSVRADLSSIGGSASQTLFDDGTNGDQTSGDGVFSVGAVVAVGTAIGAKTLPVTVTDDQMRSSSSSIALTVEATGGISAVGASDPDFVLAGGASALLTVSVTPGTGPISSGITVEANLLAIGGAPTQAFVDDGTGGDVTAGDNVFSYLATIPAGVPAGDYSFSAIARDAQLRSTSAEIPLSVRTVSLFADGFED